MQSRKQISNAQLCNALWVRQTWIPYLDMFGSSAKVSKSGKVRQGPEHLPRPRESSQDGQSGRTNYRGLISSLCSSRNAFLGLGRVSLSAGYLVRHYNSGASLYGNQCLMSCVYQLTTSLTVTSTSQVSKVIVILVEFVDHILPVFRSEHVFVIIDFLILIILILVVHKSGSEPRFEPDFS